MSKLRVGDPIIYKSYVGRVGVINEDKGVLTLKRIGYLSEFIVDIPIEDAQSLISPEGNIDDSTLRELQKIMED